MKKALLVSLIMLCLFLAIPILVDLAMTSYGELRFKASDVSRVSRLVRSAFIHPFGKWLGVDWWKFLVIPYWFLVAYGVAWIFRKWKKQLKYLAIGLSMGLFVLFLFPNSLTYLDNDAPSISKGSVGNGRIQNAKRLPFRGANFTTYSFPLYLAGRTFVHHQLKEAVLEAYAKCERTCPKTTFVIGETGSKHGGHFAPHRTHRNGLSVDLMIPMKKNNLPHHTHHIRNLWGYGIEFDKQGERGNIEIDFETTAQLILALRQAASQNGLAIQKIIFAPELRKKLSQTSVWNQIKDLPYSQNRVWVRHDDHLHIDFRVR